MPAKMYLICPAKINLFLVVTGKRPDGYHNLFTLMCPVGLCDDIRLDFDKNGIVIDCSDPKVPTDETNLAYKAAALFFDRVKKCMGSCPSGLAIHIDKRIPVAAGLGGGSSDAAAVLKALNQKLDYPFTQKDLMQMGLALGADVPFFILAKPALATGIGEKLEIFNGLCEFYVVIVCPPISVSTAAVYKNLNLTLTKCEKKLKYPLFKTVDFNVEKYLCNDLETVTASWHSEIVVAKKMLYDSGAAGTLMSGSGPSVFGLFVNAKTARMAKRFISGRLGWQVHLTELVV
jgi:4-diphosphocytidyl-2-C-methyl-D-erythritol kinase